MKIIITGATGMVGEGVLYTSIYDSRVSEIVLISRKKSGYDHLKVREIIVDDFFNLGTQINELHNYDACYFCLGVSSVGMEKSLYEKLTYDLTLNFAKCLEPNNPNIVFIYVSGQGTDSTEKSGTHWARVKGKTENELMKLNFRNVYGFRPGFIRPIYGLKYTHNYYKYIGWLYPLGRMIYPEGFSSLKEIALAMLELSTHPISQKIIGGKMIAQLAKMKNN